MTAQTRIDRPSIAGVRDEPEPPSIFQERAREQRVFRMINTAAAMNAAKYRSAK